MLQQQQKKRAHLDRETQSKSPEAMLRVKTAAELDDDEAAAADKMAFKQLYVERREIKGEDGDLLGVIEVMEEREPPCLPQRLRPPGGWH